MRRIAATGSTSWGFYFVTLPLELSFLQLFSLPEYFCSLLHDACILEQHPPCNGQSLPDHDRHQMEIRRFIEKPIDHLHTPKLSRSSPRYFEDVRGEGRDRRRLRSCPLGRSCKHNGDVLTALNLLLWSIGNVPILWTRILASIAASSASSMTFLCCDTPMA